MINFVKYRSITAIFSLCIIAAFFGVCVYRTSTRGHAFSYNVEFTGGTQVLLKFDKPMSGENLKNCLQSAGFEGVTVRSFNDQEILVKVKDFSSDTYGLSQKMIHAVNEQNPGYTISVLQTEAVGPGIGAELRWKSLRVILIGLFVLLIYIALRFWSIPLAVGAVVALAHDALIMLAVFLFLDKEISINVIGAILAVLGYSINDTIVIFSQIRKNLNKLREKPLAEIVDISLNQTLRRTLLTSVSTALSVISMLIFGGEALRDFSLTLLVGIIFGTYSSVYIASPVMMLLEKRK
jgi:preprotein translocase subunit SecF